MKNMKTRVAQMTQLLELHFWKTIKLSINHNSKNQRFKWLVSNFIPTDSKKFEFQNFK